MPIRETWRLIHGTVFSAARNKAATAPFEWIVMPDVSSSDEHRERVATWVREHAEAVRGYVLALVRRPELADDVVQDVFCRAWQARERYVDQGHPRAYLLRIADRLVCDRNRRSGREVDLSDEAWQDVEPTVAEGEPGSSLALREDTQAATAALDRLSEVQRRVLLLRFFGNLEFHEIAATLGCPVNTALSHCRRGLLKLREVLVQQP